MESEIESEIKSEMQSEIESEIESELDDNNNKISMLCHIITNDSKINYQTNKKNKFKFNANDILYKINNNNFDSNGMIYYKELDMAIPIDTFIMIESFFSDSLEVNILKFNKEYKKINQIIYPKSFDEIYNVSVFNKYKYIYWRGLIFTELSEELILNFNKTRMKLDGIIFTQYKQIDPDCDKYVVLLDIDYKVLNLTLADKLKAIGLPYVKFNNSYQILVLHKICNIKINNLNHLENILNDIPIDKQDNKIIFLYNNFNKHIEEDKIILEI
jgi:hypothetical protein